MAAADYRLCDVCDAKTFYDADTEYDFTSDPSDPKPQGVGAWKVLCWQCTETHEAIVVVKDDGAAITSDIFTEIKQVALNAGAPGYLTVNQSLSRIVRLCIDAQRKATPPQPNFEPSDGER